MSSFPPHFSSAGIPADFNILIILKALSSKISKSNNLWLLFVIF